ncbi:MAG: hypothetical protein R3311_20825, partial [Oceanisphaera sp.]|nr:hypothetical protein [Oceanisphaera sp.]
FTLCTALATPAFGAEEITVNYQYEGNVRTDFSSMSRGPMKVAEFADARGGEANLIADGYMADRALAAIVRDALVQGLEKGKAGLVDSGENMTLAGTLQSAQLQTVDDNGVSSMQLTIRTRVQLQSGGRTIWETVLFGRGTAPETAGMGQALADALDRTVRGLLQDDYFLIEVL